MANIMTKRGSLDNIVTYEHICDTKQDLDNIESAYVTLGSTAIVLNEDNGPGVYMADSNKEWNSLTGGSENMNDNSNISVDATLTQSEAAADAKVTGDKIAEINTTINELKNVIQSNTFDPVTNFNNIKVIGNREVSRSGRYLNSYGQQSGVALDNSEGYLYVYKGSTITANNGYKFSYAIWENPPISGSLEDSPIIMQLDVSKQTITIEHDGYLVLSASMISGYYPSQVNPQAFIESAITIKLYLENTKEKLSSITIRLGALEEAIQGLQEQINNLT